MSTIKNRPEAERMVYEIIARQAFARLGWNYDTEVAVSDPSDDIRLIQAAAPAFVDITLDEVLKVMHSETEKVMGKEVPEHGYTYSAQEAILAHVPSKSSCTRAWARVRIASQIDLQEAYETWCADDRFTVRVAEPTHELYVKRRA